MISEKKKQKIENINRSIQKNQEKIAKLEFINSQLVHHREKLEKPVEKPVLTALQREEQSARDKEEFWNQFEISKRFD